MTYSTLCNNMVVIIHFDIFAPFRYNVVASCDSYAEFKDIVKEIGKYVLQSYRGARIKKCYFKAE